MEPAQYPSKRPSITDVAKLAGVSQSAVSKVLRGAYGVSKAMETKVNSAIQELGYRPRTGARAMRGKSNLIGFEIPQVGNEFFTQIILGASEQLENTGFQLLIAPALAQAQGQRAIDALIDHQVDGLIAISPEVMPQALDQVAAYLPLVMIGRHDSSKNYDTVTSDDAKGITLAMNHLVLLGHRSIVHLTIQPAIDLDEAKSPHASRLDRYLEICMEQNLQPEVAFCDADEQGAYSRTLEILKAKPRATAILAGNDTLAIGAMRAISEQGLGPGDVSVIGYDDIDIASHPMISLTTVNQDGKRVGREAVSLLLERIAGTRATARHVQIKPELQIRKSTEKPNLA